MVKIGNVELTNEDALILYNERKYIVAYKKIYEIKYSNAQNRFYGSLLYQTEYPLTRRGRYFSFSAYDVNDLLGFKLLNE